MKHCPQVGSRPCGASQTKMALNRIKKELSELLLDPRTQEIMIETPRGDWLTVRFWVPIPPALDGCESLAGRAIPLTLSFPSDYPFKPFKLKEVPGDPIVVLFGSASNESWGPPCFRDQWSPALSTNKYLAAVVATMARGSVEFCDPTPNVQP